MGADCTYCSTSSGVMHVAFVLGPGRSDEGQRESAEGLSQQALAENCLAGCCEPVTGQG